MRKFTQGHLSRTPRSPGLAYSMLVGILLALAAMACSFSTPEQMNDGKGGSRNNPVPANIYARTTDFDVRVLELIWDREVNDEAGDAEYDLLLIQFQVRCDKAESEVCDLEQIRKDISLVDARGVLYGPVFLPDLKDPLGGEILGDNGEKMGWVAYQIPSGIEILAAVAKYGEEGAEQRLFFQLQ